MYRMLIVDDQMKEIDGIMQMMDWEKAGIQVVGFATNGQTGLEEALRLKPDIILADIVMPIMDGLEMINQIRQTHPEVKVVFISHHDDFKFISKAIEHGAFGYVIKPVLPGELIKTLNKTLISCEKEKKSLELLLLRQKVMGSMNLLKEQFYRNLFLGVIAEDASILEQADFLEVDIEQKTFCALCIEIDSGNDQKILFHAVPMVEKLKSRFHNDLGLVFILLDLTHIGVLFINDSNNLASSKKLFLRKAQEIMGFIDEEYEITITTGIGNVVLKPSAISQSYLLSRKALQYTFYLGRGRLIDCEEVNIKTEETDIQLDEISDTVKQIIFSCNPEIVEQFIGSHINASHTVPLLKYVCYTIVNMLQLHLLQIQLNADSIIGNYSRTIHIISSCESLEELKDRMKRVIMSVIDNINGLGRVEELDLIQKMEDYIRQNYALPLMLEDVAGKVFLSPGHANCIFKNVTGKTLHQYVEEVRVTKAVELLRDKREKKVYEIAEKTGFSNSAYFINVFRKHYGCTPLEYRRKMI